MSFFLLESKINKINFFFNKKFYKIKIKIKKKGKLLIKKNK